MPSSNETATGSVGSTSKCCGPFARCRTAALGGHLDECTRCGHRATISYNSCRNRHCPKCQTAARDRWIAARRQELLPTRYVHVVFTLPRRLAPLVLQNKKVLYDLLFRTSAETLLEVARDPRHLGAEIGFFSVLAHLEPETQPSPACPLCRSCRRPLARSHPLDSPRDNYFLPKKVLRESFAASSSTRSKRPFRMASSTSTET